MNKPEWALTALFSGLFLVVIIAVLFEIVR